MNTIRKYSIITPNYNGFSLMKNYFQSLENQTYKDFEVIIVDDYSSDDSLKELQNYAANSKLAITVIGLTKNSGPGNARNVGMDHAKGEWITFIDNDDWVENTFLKEINDVIATNNIECVIFDYYVKNSKKQIISNSMYRGSQGIVTMSECMMYVRNHAVGKVYNLNKCREHNIKYPKTRRCEDVAFVVQAINACGSAYYYKKPLYFYLQRGDSLSNNKKMNANDMVKSFQIIEQTLGNKYREEIAAKSVTDLLYGGVLMMCKAGEKKHNIIAYIDWYESKYPDWKKTSIINEVGRAKRIFLKAIQYRCMWLLKGLTLVHTILV